MIFRLDAKPVIPGECVADDETAEDVVGSQDTDNPEGEERQGDTEGEEGFVVYEPVCECQLSLWIL